MVSKGRVAPVNRPREAVFAVSWYAVRVSVQSVVSSWIGVFGKHFPRMVPVCVTVDLGPTRPWRPQEDAAFLLAAPECHHIGLKLSPPFTDAAFFQFGEHAVADTSLRIKSVTAEDTEKLFMAFCELADDISAYAGVGEVVTGFLWRRGELWSDRETQPTRTLVQARGREFLGLPPYPTAWLLLGREFPPSALSAYGAQASRPTSRGTVIGAAHQLLDREALATRPDVVGLTWRASWTGGPGRLPHLRKAMNLPKLSTGF